ncbi:hypothetical protein [Sulfurimonas sp.]|uniref:hypothetical protein n=1 Tax=Sulfurimonas sp. TaxID=2022749 RepID=UPI0025F5A183|nr:hypothetical protein [Sulfurimonas sp.]MBW6488976.1 hypothetical protein [Sulfurimonas sp.]
MDGSLYPVSLLVVAVMAFYFYRTNNVKLMLFALVVGIYIIYSHNTGVTITDYKNEVVDSISDSATEFVKERNIEGYNESKKVVK